MSEWWWVKLNKGPIIGAFSNEDDDAEDNTSTGIIDVTNESRNKWNESKPEGTNRLSNGDLHNTN